MLTKLKNWWAGVKAWFKNSETIFLSRLTAFVGFVTAVVGGMDWSPLSSLDLSTGFNKSQIISLGITMLIQGVVLELARRRNAQDL